MNKIDLFVISSFVIRGIPTKLTRLNECDEAQQNSNYSGHCESI